MYPDTKDPLENINAMDEELRYERALAEIDRIIAAVRSSEINDNESYFKAIMPLVQMMPEDNKLQFRQDVMDLLNKHAERSQRKRMLAEQQKAEQ